MIINASSGDTIILPSENIILPNILISKPITLKGSAGTVLEIQNGSIVVDFKENYSSQNRAIICEINIIYSITTEKICKENNQPFGLFILNGKNTVLEIRDCQIKSNNSEKKESMQNWIEIEDACFWVNGYGYKKRFPPALSKFNSVLYVKSCHISHFHNAVIGGINCSIIIEKSDLNNISGNGIKVLNPREISILQTRFSKCGNNGIDLRIIPLSKNVHSGGSSHSTSTDSHHFSKLRIISIHMSEFKSCGGIGIHL